MIRLLVLVSAALALAGYVPVIWDTLRRNARPVAVSWAGWAAIVAIGAAGSAEARQLPSLVYTGLCAAGCGAVAVLALRIPVTLRDDPVMVPLPWGGRARLDLLCLPAAAAGLALLAAARNPGLAVAVSVVTDAVLYLPTIGHAWQHPEHEPWAAYGLFGLGAGAALAAAALGGHAGSMAAAGYLWYLAVADTGVMAIILARRLISAAADAASPSPGQAHEGAAAVARAGASRSEGADSLMRSLCSPPHQFRGIPRRVTGDPPVDLRTDPPGRAGSAASPRR